jgi:hypothetical protein
MLGAMVDTTTFGICVIAFLMVGAIDQVVGRLTGGVTLSALSEVARRGGDLRAAYYRLHAPIAAFAYFSAGFLMVAGQALVAALYDHRYAEAGWMLQILAVLLLAAPFQIAVQAYLALGRPELHSRILAVRLAALFTLMPIGFLLTGLTGALWGGVAAQLLTVPLVIFYNTGKGLFAPKHELLALAIVPLGAVVGRFCTLVIAT